MNKLFQSRERSSSKLEVNFLGINETSGKADYTRGKVHHLKKTGCIKFLNETG